MLRILIIDNDSSICKALAMDLSKDDVMVDTVRNGKAGIHLGCQKPYDILITDLFLPDINGLEVLKKIRRALPDIASVIITGDASIETTLQAFRIGVVDYLEKPFTLASIRSVIADVQGKKNY